MVQPMHPKYWVGVDTGGTFTDAFAIGSDGAVHLAKTPSTPNDLSLGIMTSIELLAESAGISPEAFLARTQELAHGTTATVNAMVQRRGAKAALMTTGGFRDHFILMKGARGVGVPDGEKIRFSRAVKPEPIVPYDRTEEITERVDYAGRIVIPLDEAETREKIRRLAEQGVEAIAVSLLWSFRNPAHELRVRDLIREMYPHISVTMAHDLVPVIGEYERTATAVINAYLEPVLGRYVYSLERTLANRGFKRHVLLMQSDGGLVPGQAAPNRAVTTMLSGLAAGVLGAKQIGLRIGIDNIIAIDMGGTSFEVSLVHKGRPVMENFPLTPRLNPYELRWKIAAPSIDITAIGAGGGSIAQVVGGLLKVGPQSAGADPGPACYGRAGTLPTVTDAFLVLGYLDPENFLGGRMKVYPEHARAAIERHVAQPLGISVHEAAHGIYRVVISHMADLIHKVTVQRGYDVRDFVMLAFGGSGPIHASVLGQEIGVRKTIIPGAGLATALSAYGLATSDLRYTVAQSRVMAEPLETNEVRKALEEVKIRALDTVQSWNMADGEILVSCSLDMRFVGQAHSVNVPIPNSIQHAEDLGVIVGRFMDAYERAYGKSTAHRQAGIEIVTFRAEAIGPVTMPELPNPGLSSRRAADAQTQDATSISRRHQPATFRSIAAEN